MAEFEFVSSLFLLCAFVFVYQKIYGGRSWKLLNKFPGPPMLPFLGNAHLALLKKDVAHKYALELKATYGDRIRGALGHHKGLALFHPKDLEKLLLRTDTINKPDVYHLYADYVGDSMPFARDKRWHARRKLLTPAFNCKALEAYSAIFNEQTHVFIDIVKEKLQKGENIIDAGSLFLRLAFDIVCETVASTKMNYQRDMNQEYAEAFTKTVTCQFRRGLNPLLHIRMLYDRTSLGKEGNSTYYMIQDFFAQVQAKKKAALQQEMESKSDGGIEEPSCTKNPAILDLMLQWQMHGRSGMSDAEILGETMTFIFSGHDTTATCMTWTLFLLGSHPEEQEKVIKEVDELFGADERRSVEWKDLPHLKHLECCIKEALRLYPPAPAFGRKVETEFELDDGAIVPAGVNVIISPWVIHRDERFWPNPEEFRPDRFLPENCANRPLCSFLTFVAGPRNCIGQKYAMVEVKIILAHLFRHFRVVTLNPEKVVPTLELVTRPQEKIEFRFESRT